VNSGSVFNAGTGVYTLSGTSKTIGGTTTSLTIPNLTVSGSYTNNVNGLNISTALAGVGSLIQGTGAFLNLGGTFAITTLTATANPNTVEYSFTSTGQTLKAITYHHLIIDISSQTATLGGTTVLNGDLTINSGILQLSTSNLTVAGTTTIVGTITDNSTTGTNSFNNVEFKGGTITGTVTSTYGISGYLNVSQGNGTLDASNFNITGTTTIASGKILTISSATGSKSFADVTVNGTWTNSINCPISISGSLTVNSGILFTSGTGIYTLSGTSRSISGTGNFTVSNLTITGSYTNNTNLTVALALAGTGSLTQTANSTLNLGGSISVSGLVASANPNTVIYACTNSAQTIKSTTYYHLTIDNSGQIANGSSGIIVNGNLAVLSGTLADLGYTITGNSSGTFSIASGAAFTTTRTASPFFPSAYTSFNFDNNSTVNFNGAGGHNLPASPSSYGNIGIGGSGTKVLTAGTTTINGTLIITAGGLQIPENTNLTVKGNFTNNGTFLISSSASGTGSFMDNGTITGTGTYTIQKYLIGGGGTSARWWYLGSSVTAATTAVFNATNVDHGVFTHSQTTGSYTQIKNNTTVLNALQGYAVKFRDADLTANFSGTPNTGIYSINLTGNGSGYGWNLVSNPYPSAIDWDATSGWTKTNVSDVIYYRTNGMYATYNSISGIGTNGGQSYIPAMQGFWVKNISATGTLSVSNAVRLHSNQAYYKSNNKINSSKSNMLRLTAIHSGHKDESVIYFTPNATDGIDNYDTELISNTDTAFAQIYTVVSGKKLSVNSLSQLTKSVSIPLGFKTGNSGIFSISAANIGSFGANVTIILEDILLNKTQILSQNPLYTFTSGVVNDTKRFVIHFNVITGADAGSDVTICNSKATILNGSGGGTYRWSTGSRLRSIAVNPSVTTTYTLTVTSSLGKTSTDNVVVYVNSPIVNAGNDKVICKGNSVTLASTGNGTIKWSNNDTTSAITVSPKVIKIYTVTVSSGGCTASDAVLVRVNSLPVINAGNDLTICGNSHVALNASGNGTFMWNTGQNSTSISVNPSVTSTYTITSTNNNGCSASDQVIVYVVNNCKTNENIIIGETSEFKLFPNPASDVIYFYNNKFNSGNINVKIYNIIGDKLMDKTINTQNTEINVSGLHAGMYSVLITGNGIIYKDIFIKQ
ncbi:MAG: T9SS type A sorting domain-containing protein, partial [Bacteroidota bacterium]|nr:T9SS type A sorting domain-containing protein [Bacteroidota bacterium]